MHSCFTSIYTGTYITWHYFLLELEKGYNLSVLFISSYYFFSKHDVYMCMPARAHRQNNKKLERRISASHTVTCMCISVSTGEYTDIRFRCRQVLPHIYWLVRQYGSDGTCPTRNNYNSKKYTNDDWPRDAHFSISAVTHFFILLKFTGTEVKSLK